MLDWFGKVGEFFGVGKGAGNHPAPSSVSRKEQDRIIAENGRILMSLGFEDDAKLKTYAHVPYLISDWSYETATKLYEEGLITKTEAIDICWIRAQYLEKNDQERYIREKELLEAERGMLRLLDKFPAPYRKEELTHDIITHAYNTSGDEKKKKENHALVDLFSKDLPLRGSPEEREMIVKALDENRSRSPYWADVYASALEKLGADVNKTLLPTDLRRRWDQLGKEWEWRPEKEIELLPGHHRPYVEMRIDGAQIARDVKAYARLWNQRLACASERNWLKQEIMKYAGAWPIKGPDDGRPQELWIPEDGKTDDMEMLVESVAVFRRTPSARTIKAILEQARKPDAMRLASFPFAAHGHDTNPWIPLLSPIVAVPMWNETATGSFAEDAKNLAVAGRLYEAIYGRIMDIRRLWIGKQVREMKEYKDSFFPTKDNKLERKGFDFNTELNSRLTSWSCRPISYENRKDPTRQAERIAHNSEEKGRDFVPYPTFTGNKHTVDIFVNMIRERTIYEKPLEKDPTPPLDASDRDIFWIADYIRKNSPSGKKYESEWGEMSEKLITPVVDRERVSPRPRSDLIKKDEDLLRLINENVFEEGELKNREVLAKANQRYNELVRTCAGLDPIFGRERARGERDLNAPWDFGLAKPVFLWSNGYTLIFRTEKAETFILNNGFNEYLKEAEKEKKSAISYANHWNEERKQIRARLASDHYVTYGNIPEPNPDYDAAAKFMAYEAKRHSMKDDPAIIDSFARLFPEIGRDTIANILASGAISSNEDMSQRELANRYYHKDNPNFNADLREREDGQEWVDKLCKEYPTIPREQIIDIIVSNGKRAVTYKGMDAEEKARILQELEKAGNKTDWPNDHYGIFRESWRMYRDALDRVTKALFSTETKHEILPVSASVALKTVRSAYRKFAPKYLSGKPNERYVKIASGFRSATKRLADLDAELATMRESLLERLGTPNGDRRYFIESNGKRLSVIDVFQTRKEIFNADVAREVFRPEALDAIFSAEVRGLATYVETPEERAHRVNEIKRLDPDGALYGCVSGAIDPKIAEIDSEIATGISDGSLPIGYTNDLPDTRQAIEAMERLRKEIADREADQKNFVWWRRPEFDEEMLEEFERVLPIGWKDVLRTKATLRKDPDDDGITEPETGANPVKPEPVDPVFNPSGTAREQIIRLEKIEEAVVRYSNLLAERENALIERCDRAMGKIQAFFAKTRNVRLAELVSRAEQLAVGRDKKSWKKILAGLPNYDCTYSELEKMDEEMRRKRGSFDPGSIKQSPFDFDSITEKDMSAFVEKMKIDGALGQISTSMYDLAHNVNERPKDSRIVYPFVPKIDWYPEGDEDEYAWDTLISEMAFEMYAYDSILKCANAFYLEEFRKEIPEIFENMRSRMWRGGSGVHVGGALDPDSPEIVLRAQRVSELANAIDPREPEEIEEAEKMRETETER